MEADLARVPLLVLTADRPAELHGIGANQTVEQSGLYGDAVRWASTSRRPSPRRQRSRTGASSPAAAVVALPRRRRRSRAGPVHLNLRAPRAADRRSTTASASHYDLGLNSHAASPSDAPGLRPTAAGGLATRAVAVYGTGSWSWATRAGDPEPLVRLVSSSAGWPLIAEPHSNARRGPHALRAADAAAARRRRSRRGTSTRPRRRRRPRRAVPSRCRTGSRHVRHIVVSPDGGNWDVDAVSGRGVIRCDRRCSISSAPTSRSTRQRGWIDGVARRIALARVPRSTPCSTSHAT